MRTCKGSGCSAPHKARGYCQRHYTYHHGRGDFSTTPCLVESCDRMATRQSGLCSTHDQRLKRGGDMTVPIRPVGAKGSGYIDDQGYRRVGSRKEHRIVMEQILGRPLRKFENVHHLNGVKTDNRPDNLELWVSRQPKGQRVEDKVTYAVEMLRLYAPHLLEEDSK